MQKPTQCPCGKCTYRAEQEKEGNAVWGKYCPEQCAEYSAWLADNVIPKYTDKEAKRL